jgi:uncharacterized membrane protein
LSEKGLMKKKMKRVFLTGLAVVIPAGLTIYILFFIIDMMDNLLRVIPDSYHPDKMLQLHIPGLGVIVTVILIFSCGLVTTSYFGNRIVRFGERIVGKIPFVRSVYQAIKQIAEGLFMDKAQSFKKVVIVEYPRCGVYSIGFITGSPNGEIQKSLRTKSPCVGIYIPCALTPTTGVFVMIPRDELIEVSMSVEEAFTLIISAGIVTPPERLSPYSLKPVVEQSPAVTSK